MTKLDTQTLERVTFTAFELVRVTFSPHHPKGLQHLQNCQEKVTQKTPDHVGESKLGTSDVKLGKNPPQNAVRNVDFGDVFSHDPYWGIKNVSRHS